MKVRTRLVLAFGYILLTVMIALGVPLAANLQRRAEAEVETNLLVRAQTLAANVGGESVRSPGDVNLQRILRENAQGFPGRIIVVDAEGILVADSDGPDSLGRDYATPGRPEVRLALAREPNSNRRFSDELNQEIVVAAAPIVDEDARGELVVAGVVRITQGLAEVEENVRRTTIGLVAIGVAGLLAGLLLAFGLAGSIARPLDRLAGAARRLGRADLSARAGDVGGTQEITDLAHSFDDMADRLERTVSAQREFVANASHQLRTPLTGMKLRLESAVADAPSDEIRRQLRAADREVDRLAEIVDRLLVMAKEIDSGERTHVDVDHAAGRALERWRERAQRAGASISARGAGGISQGDPSDLDQILDNLLDNAIAYAPGPIEIGAERRNDVVILTVRDHGPGIPAHEIDRVSERFYRGAGVPSGGSGLGLSIASQLTQKWGGATTLRAPEDGGLLVEVSLRAASPDRRGGKTT